MSAPDNSAPAAYFCYKCTRHFTDPTDDFCCPYCREGFMELVTSDGQEDAAAESDYATAEPQPTESAGSNRTPFMNGLTMMAGPARTALGPNIVATLNMPFRPNSASDFSNFVFHGDGALELPALFEGSYVGDFFELDNFFAMLLNQLESSAPPLSQADIDRIPTEKVGSMSDQESNQCSVCLEEFAQGVTVRRLPCSHRFHEPCILPWLQSHNSCPVCRKAVLQNRTFDRTYFRRRNSNRVLDDRMDLD